MKTDNGARIANAGKTEMHTTHTSDARFQPRDVIVSQIIQPWRCLDWQASTIVGKPIT